MENNCGQGREAAMDKQADERNQMGAGHGSVYLQSQLLGARCMRIMVKGRQRQNHETLSEK
jgi:hypothetical protein